METVVCSGLQSWGELRVSLKAGVEVSEITRARPPHVEKVLLAFPTSIRPRPGCAAATSERRLKSHQVVPL